MQRIAVGMSERVNALVAPNVFVVDLMCDARILEPASFSSDGFHPSDRGYALMADLAYTAVTSATYPAPAADCALKRVAPITEADPNLNPAPSACPARLPAYGTTTTTSADGAPLPALVMARARRSRRPAARPKPRTMGWRRWWAVPKSTRPGAEPASST